MRFSLSLLLLLGVLVAHAADHVNLVTFDGAKGTTHKWKLVNDPVMGGLSHSNWTIDSSSKTAKWAGAVEIVPSLKAPGFCNAETENGVFAHFNDASPYTHLELRLRASLPYDGYKVSFSADTINPQFKSYKADFPVPASADWQVVAIPFSNFSNDWSAFTGDCSTKDPNGRQHVCCTKETPEVCPSLKNLKDISEIGLWNEGHAGNFSMEIDWVRAGFGDTCAPTEYCCPDAQHCLTPSKISCKSNASACDGTKFPVCCPLTQICVAPGAKCTTPCSSGDAYCCPDAKHCLKPTNPGVFCDAKAPCAKGEVCCPLTKVCVAVEEPCSPFDAPIAPWWPAHSEEVKEEVAAPPPPPTIGDWTCSAPVQAKLRYNISGRFNVPGMVLPFAKGETLADAICCDSAFKPFAEPPDFFSRVDVRLFDHLSSPTTTFYDSVCGIPLFTAPQGRTVAEWKEESVEHGWPSFRPEEVVKGNVIVNKDTKEVVSKCGTHLGSLLPDDKGPRYCLDLSCLSGNPSN